METEEGESTEFDSGTGNTVPSSATEQTDIFSLCCYGEIESLKQLLQVGGGGCPYMFADNLFSESFVVRAERQPKPNPFTVSKSDRCARFDAIARSVPVWSCSGELT